MADQCPPHHFDIAIANGPYSLGTCRHCGETKQFQNFVDGVGQTFPSADRKQQEDEKVEDA
ncbi:MAG: hypothetical protein O2821_12710 [Chloroflexi bacterium]|nr:hypothetical protein [Chloroflexota bacterium]